MSLVKINWHPDAKELRKFGFVVLIGFAIIGAIFFFASKTSSAYYLWGIGVVLGFPGLTGTAIALPFYLIWMGVAFIIGNIMSRLIMFVIFFAVVTPLGIIMRLTGRDRLKLKKSNDSTYWVDVPTGEQDYQQQF